MGCSGQANTHRPRRVLPAALRAAAVAGALGACASAMADPPTYDIETLGLIGVDHTRSSDGFRTNTATGLSNTGFVSGNATRWSGTTNLGQSAWLYNSIDPSYEIGLLGDGHERDSDGFRNNASLGVSDNGFVLGKAARYDVSALEGQSVWIYDSANGTANPDATEIGLMGAGYELSTGYRFNDATSINTSGAAVGYAERFELDVSRGRAAWVYNGTTTEIGLGVGAANGTEHVRSDGYRYNYDQRINDNGFVLGTAERYNGATPAGQSVWLYNGSSSSEIGLRDAGYEFTDGSSLATAVAISNGNQAAGWSYRYSGSTWLGLAAWVHNGGTDTQVGLGIGAANSTEFVRSDGYRDSRPTDVNDSGQAVGTANRYNIGADMGLAAWRYDGSTTTQIGLTSAVYTRNDGRQENRAAFINNAGDVAGHAVPYAGATSLGQSGWFFDAVAETTTELVFSIRSSDQFRFTSIEYLGDDGVLLGAYQLFDGNTDMGNHAFRWSTEDGFSHLGFLVDGGITDAGWTKLAVALRSNALDQVLGHGLLIGNTANGQDVFLLSVQEIPEPATLSLLALGGLLALRRRRA